MGKPLTNTEKVVAFAAQFHARDSIALVSRKARLKSHTVRYALERMLERKVLHPYTFIDVDSLGFTAYNILCALSSHRVDIRHRFEKALVSHPNVSGVYRIGGDFHYRIVVLAKTNKELLDIVDGLLGAYSDMIFERSFVIRAGAWLFSRKYLNPKAQPETPLHVEPGSGSRPMDRIDATILQLMGQPGPWHNSQLAAKLRLPLSTFEYRVRRLEKEGIVKGWVYSIDAGAFGMFDYRLLVTMKQVDEETRNTFYHFCAKHPQVNTLVRCIGSWDYELGIEVSSREQIIEIVQTLYESFSTTVRAVKVIPVFDCLKTSMFPFRVEDLVEQSP